jgi:hypothetical protein
VERTLLSAAVDLAFELTDSQRHRCHPESATTANKSALILPAKDLCICTLRLIPVPKKPALAQVLPFRVHGHDQCNLLNSQPTFNLFFPRNRIVNITETLKVDKTVDLVARSKTAVRTVLVLEDSLRSRP